jgi:nitrate reductase NapAB chaperone NapD
MQTAQVNKPNGTSQNGNSQNGNGQSKDINLVLTDAEKAAINSVVTPAKTVEEVQAKINHLKSKSDEVVRLKSQLLEISELSFSKESGRGKVVFIDDNNNQFEIKNTDTITELKNHVINIGKEHINKVETTLLTAQL